MFKVCNDKIVRLEVIDEVHSAFGACQICREKGIQDEKRYFVSYPDGTNEVSFIIRTADDQEAIAKCREDIDLYVQECERLEDEEDD